MAIQRLVIIIAGCLLTFNLISQNDKVGINTTDPQDMLNVKGGILAQGSVLVGENAIPPIYHIDEVSGLTDTSGILYDSGGPLGDYGNNESFTVTVNPPNPTGDLIGIRITVDSLDLAAGDFLQVAFVGSADTLTGIANGLEFTTSYTFAILKFVSDASSTSTGFKITWNGLYLTPDDTTEIDDLSGRFHWISSKQALRSGYVTGDHWALDSIGKYSMAAGKDVKATGESTVAFGKSSIASATGSVAFGVNNKATGSNSLAMGNGAQASGTTAFSLGFQTRASGLQSFASGNWSFAESRNVFAIGRYNTGGGHPTSWNETDPLFEIGFGTSDEERANAMLIRKDASALWTGEFDLVPNNPPASGPGTRMMWYPGKAAFRAGDVDGTQWDGLNIGNYSVALGKNTWALGESSTALGNATMAFGTNSTAIGLSTNASGQSSTAMGSITSASGNNATAMGSNTTANGNTATAMGSGTAASGAISTALGWNSTSESMASVALGRYNVGGGNAVAWFGPDPLFEIGIGTSAEDSANAMTIFKNAGALWEGVFDDTSPDPPPAEGVGTRMMWYPDKAAFRAGYLVGPGVNFWDQDSIGNTSFAAGVNTRAIGDYSTAMGIGTRAIGSQTTALGGGTFAWGSWATALGRDTEAYGISSIAMGEKTQAHGSSSTAMGRGTIASGISSMTSGDSTNASGWYSTALGSSTQAEALASVAFGRYNVGGGNASIWLNTDPLFEIGIGTSSSDSANAITVLKNGNFGLGTHVPATSFHLKKGTGSGDPTSDLVDAFIEDDFAYLEFSGDPFGGITFKDDGESVHAGVLYNYQNDELEFKNSVTTLRLHETGVLSLLSGGKLGIGTTLPASLLHVKSGIGGGNPASSEIDIVLEDANAFMEISGSGTSGYTFFDDGSSFRGGMIYEYGNDALNFNTSGLIRLTMAENGNVGIGTVSPSAKLHVEGTIEVDQRIEANDSGGLEFATDDAVIRMKIADNGNIGIGTNNPSEKLEVAGGVQVDGNTFNIDEINNRVGIGTTSPSSILDIRGFDPTMIIDNTATTGNYTIEWQENSLFRGSVGYSLTSDYLFIYEDGTVMVQDGNLGVGVTSIPTGHKLEVNGGAYCDGSSWTNSSSRDLKENLNPVSGKKILEKLAGLDVYEWNYIKDDDELRHIGPMAESFYTAFGLGMDNTSISTVDISGVALAAIQELNNRNDELIDLIKGQQETISVQQKDIQALKSENAELKSLLLELSRRVRSLENN